MALVVRNGTKKRKTISRTVTVRSQMATKSFVRNEIRRNQEMKAFFKQSDTDVPISGTLVNVSNILQGIEGRQRIGDNVLLERLHIKFQIIASTAENRNVVRIVVFQWIQGTTPVLADIFENTGIPWLSSLTYDVRQIRKVLFDRSWATIKAGDGSGTSQYVATVNISKFREKKMNFLAELTSGENQIYVMMVSDSVTGDKPVVTFHSMLTYRDG